VVISHGSMGRKVPRDVVADSGHGAERV
jgi:hypothetical protein